MAAGTVVAFDAEPTEYASAATPQVQVQRSTVAPSPAASPLPHALLFRHWYAVRWSLARTVFARPVPFLTTKLQLKLGDCLVTLPVASAFIAFNAVQCNQREVSGSGGPPAVVMLIVFALAVRNNSILLTATGLPFDRAIFYHKFFGGVAWIVSGLHGLAYLLQQSDFGARRTRQLGRGPPGSRGSGEGDGQSTLSREFTGALTFYALSALVAFAFEPIRRRFYEFFHRMHWVFFLLIVIFGVMHGAGLMLFGFVPWVIDLLYRFAYRAPKLARQGSGIQADDVTIKLVAKDIVRIQFPRRFAYEAGQYAFICIPKVARLEWHPFTIASAPHEPNVTFYIKGLGDWTKKLVAIAATTEHLTVLVDGPYGAVGIELDRYAHLVLVSGGIGVTPMRSIMNDLYYTTKIAKNRRLQLEKARFIWAVREREMLQALVLDDKPQSDEPPTAWFPHVIASPSHANSLERDAFVADFYLTNKDQDLSNAVDQQLALCLKHKQRPDMAKILSDMGEAAQRTKSVNSLVPVRIGVLVCGPAPLVAEVVAQSQVLTKRLGVAFDVHTESFAW